MLNCPVPNCPTFLESGFLALGSEEKCFFSKSPKWPIFKLLFPEPEKYFGNFPVTTCFAFFFWEKVALGNPCVNTLKRFFEWSQENYLLPLSFQKILSILTQHLLFTIKTQKSMTIGCLLFPDRMVNIKVCKPGRHTLWLAAVWIGPHHAYINRPTNI